MFKQHLIPLWNHNPVTLYFYLPEGWEKKKKGKNTHTKQANKQTTNQPDNPTKQNKVVEINQQKPNLAFLERMPMCPAVPSSEQRMFMLADHMLCNILIFLPSLISPQ